MDGDKEVCESRLTKNYLFKKYDNVMQNLPGTKYLYHVVGGTYNETKCAARNYQVIDVKFYKILSVFLMYIYLLGC